MKGAKVHSGVLDVKSATADKKYVHNFTILKPADWDIPTVSGAASKAIGHTNNQSLPCREFPFDDVATVGGRNVKYVGFSTVVPSNIPDDTKLNVILYWTLSGTTSGVVSGTGVVWDMDYRNTELLVSGALSADVNYVVSGTLSNTTKSVDYDGGKGLISGALNTTALVVPAKDVKAGRIINGLIYRDLAESGDDRTMTACLLYIVLEYMEDRS